MAGWRLWLLGVFFVAIMNWRPQGFTLGVLRHFVAPENDLLKRPGSAVAASVQPSSPDTAVDSPIVSADTNILVVQNVTRRFDALVAVDDVSFNVRQGEILSIIGPNGAGKTTLFNMVAGAFPPSAGKIYLDNKEITGLPPHEIARNGIARTFQNISLCPRLSVLDNTMITRNRGPWTEMFKALKPGAAFADDLELCLDWLDRLGFSGRTDILAGDLPYADQRKLEIARAMCLEPKLLLLDEPTAGMNPQEAAEIVDVVRYINGLGVTVLLIEHNMRVAMPLSDRVIVLAYGKVIAEGKPAEVQRNDQVIRAYLGDRYGST